jgi:hypothetical protein
MPKHHVYEFQCDFCHQYLFHVINDTYYYNEKKIYEEWYGHKKCIYCILDQKIKDGREIYLYCEETENSIKFRQVVDLIDGKSFPKEFYITHYLRDDWSSKIILTTSLKVRKGKTNAFVHRVRERIDVWWKDRFGYTWHGYGTYWGGGRYFAFRRLKGKKNDHQRTGPQMQ